MKQVRHVWVLMVLVMLATASYGTEQMFMGFDAASQTMQAVVRGDAPFHAVIQYEQSNPGGFIGSVEQLPVRPTEQWSQAPLSPVDPNRMSDVPDGTRNIITATAYLYNDNEEFLGTLTTTDTLYANVDGGSGFYAYASTVPAPVMPDTIRANTAFCAHISHGTYSIPIKCDYPSPTGATPAVGDIEVYVQNGCHADTSECDEVCQPIDWNLFTWNIRSRVNCNLRLIMTYCDGQPGCICIWRSDDDLPVEFTGFQAVAGDARVNLSWTTRSESDLASFKVARSEDPENPMSWQVVAVRTARNAATGANYQVTDENVTNGRTYYYKLHVIDANQHSAVYNISGDAVVQSATPREQAAEMPMEFTLGQNYPNPFNSQTTFNFTIPTAERVSLKVYDVMGREVATVVDGNLQPNSYSINWTANGLPTGVYMYTLTAGTFTETKKLLFLK